MFKFNTNKCTSYCIVSIILIVQYKNNHKIFSLNFNIKRYSSTNLYHNFIHCQHEHSITIQIAVRYSVKLWLSLSKLRWMAEYRFRFRLMHFAEDWRILKLMYTKMEVWKYFSHKLYFFILNISQILASRTWFHAICVGKIKAPLRKLLPAPTATKNNFHLRKQFKKCTKNAIRNAKWEQEAWTYHNNKFYGYISVLYFIFSLFWYF